MKIIERRSYLGPNLYANFPSFGLRLTWGRSKKTRPLKSPGFVDALLEKVPGLHEHGCSYREPGGFVRRMREDDGTWMGHIFEHVAIALQNRAGQSVSFGKPAQQVSMGCTMWFTNTRKNGSVKQRRAHD